MDARTRAELARKEILERERNSKPGVGRPPVGLRLQVHVPPQDLIDSLDIAEITGEHPAQVQREAFTLGMAILRKLKKDGSPRPVPLEEPATGELSVARSGRHRRTTGRS